MSFSITLFLAAVLAGFVASVPIGPINLWIAHRLLQNRKAPVSYFVLGVILIDLIYVGLGFITYFFVSSQMSIDKFWHILGGLLMTGIGIMSLLKNSKKIRQQSSEEKISSQKIPFLLTGIFLCASNVALSVLWFFIASIFDYYQLALQSPYQLLLILLGVGLGDIAWFYVYMLAIRHGSHFLPSISTHRLQTLIALALIVFGLFTACSQL
jgi:threonine/homoserine/homoserine lactone efflux protein